MKIQLIIHETIIDVTIIMGTCPQIREPELFDLFLSTSAREVKLKFNFMSD